LVSPTSILYPTHVIRDFVTLLIFGKKVKKKKEGKAIPVTGRGGPYGCETSRLPHVLDNRLTDVNEDVSLTRRPPFTPRKILVLISVRG
jgi:hypothetical protein